MSPLYLEIFYHILILFVYLCLTIPNKPHLIKLLKENYIFTEFCKGIFFVAEGFGDENEQFSLLSNFRVVLL